MTDRKIYGTDAIQLAEQLELGHVLKFADASGDDARAVELGEAREIAAIDPRLIYLDMGEGPAWIHAREHDAVIADLAGARAQLAAAGEELADVRRQLATSHRLVAELREQLEAERAELRALAMRYSVATAIADGALGQLEAAAEQRKAELAPIPSSARVARVVRTDVDAGDPVIPEWVATIRYTDGEIGEHVIAVGDDYLTTVQVGEALSGLGLPPPPAVWLDGATGAIEVRW